MNPRQRKTNIKKNKRRNHLHTLKNISHSEQERRNFRRNQDHKQSSSLKEMPATQKQKTTMILKTRTRTRQTTRQRMIMMIMIDTQL